MKRISKQAVAEIETGATEYHELGKLPEKVLQFGKGNFLRAFTDWQIHQLNKQQLFNGKIVIYQPSPFKSNENLLEEQDNLYTVVLRGMQNGETVDSSEIISSVSRSLKYDQWKDVLELAKSPDLEFIFSNTTEAGIVYTKEQKPEEGKIPESFPHKITAFLYERFLRLGENEAPGVVLIPCELIERNGERLLEYVLRISEDWSLSDRFSRWIAEKNTFCNTLVDRIVTGYPKDAVEEYEERLGYIDNALTVGEPYHMFAIEADKDVQRRLPLSEGGLNVKWGDVTPHREIKVRLLNGPHTMMFSIGHLYGLDTVQEVMETETTRTFVDKAFNVIAPTVYGHESDKAEFINSVVERFLNPYNKHYLLDIGLNAVYKFKARLLPSLQRYAEKEGELPEPIVFSMAALFLFYKPVRREQNSLIGVRDGQEYRMKESKEVLALFEQAWKDYESNQSVEDTVQSLLGSRQIWGEDLNGLPNLHRQVTLYLSDMMEQGMQTALDKFVK